MPYQPDTDFGFSFETDPVVDDSQLVKAREQIETLTKTVEDLQNANRMLFRKISILLHNLRKDPDKPTIRWPNRVDAIDKFLTEIEEYKKTDEQSNATRKAS